VNHSVLGHESIVKLITYRFGLGDLVRRDAKANNIGQSFDWENPQFELPDLPDPNTVASTPCALGGDRGEMPPEMLEAHEQDLQNLEDLAVRHGFDIGDGKPESIFRLPDSIKKAAVAGGIPGA
jgi:hypothetical protein